MWASESNLERSGSFNDGIVDNTYLGSKQDHVPDTCCGKFMHSLTSFWKTRETVDTEENKELYLKTTLRELVIYGLFLVVIMIMTFGMTSGINYYFTDGLTKLFLDTNYNDNSGNLRGISNPSDIWKFFNGPLVNGLFWDQRYNGIALPPDQQNFILYENKLLGFARVRQLKVRSDSCVIASEFKQGITECFAEFSMSSEDKAPFGLENSTAWYYTNAAELGASPADGNFGTYEGGGYYFNLTTSKDNALATVKEMFDNTWITRGTRAVLVDFTVYNANINLFCVVKIVIEIAATGGAYVSEEFRTVKLLRYVTPMDYFVMACECIFLCFIIYYTIEETIEIKKHKLKYFTCFWNILDVVVILVAYVCAAFNIYRTLAVGEKLASLLEDTTSFPDFDGLSFWQLQFNRALALMVFLAWIKVFKYISFNQTMAQMNSTLEKCASDLLGFAVMFSIIFFAFAQLGYLLFGSQIDGFRNFSHSVFTLFRIILGDFDFDQLEAAHRLLGPLYFILYIFFVFFILLNMFLAIINDTYSEVKEELANRNDDFAMGDFFKKRANALMEKMHLKKEKIIDIQKALDVADKDGDSKLDFNEWRTELKQRGYADREIEALFAKYDEDGDRCLDASEKIKMQNELQAQRNQLCEEIEEQEEMTDAIVTPLIIDELTNRVTNVEDTVSDVVSRVNTVIQNLEKIEKMRGAGRTEMSKLMENIIQQADFGSRTDLKGQIQNVAEKEIKKWDSNSLGASNVTSSRVTMR